jgi:sporulation-control protein spo0M
MIPSVSDAAFEAVLFDIENHPMSSMKATAARTGIGYATVTFCVRHMVAEGSIVRRRIGHVRGGKGCTYANMVSDNFRF